MNRSPALPSIDLVLGAAGCGKTAAAVQQVLASRAGRALVLVPGRTQYDQLRAQLGRPRGVYLVQFLGLARRLLRLDGQLPRLLDRMVRPAVVRALLHDMYAEGGLRAYGAVALKPGFVASLAELFDDLGNADIDGAAFAAAARTDQDAELAAAYRRYLKFQEQRGVADLPRSLRLARNRVLARPELARGYDALVVDGFDQFTPLQLSLLAAVAPHVPQVVVTLTGARIERAAHRRFQRTRAELQAVFQTRETFLGQPPAGCDPALQHLEAHLFELDRPPTQPSAGDAIALVEAADREREVRAVLRRVARLIERGTAPEAVGVLFRDGAAYTALLRTVANEYGLPIALAEGLPLDQAPPVVALRGLLRLAVDDYPRRTLAEMLRNPYLGALNLGVDSLSPGALADRLNALARARGIAGGLDRWRAALDLLEADEATFAGVAPEVGAIETRAAFERLVALTTPAAPASTDEHLAWVRRRLDLIQSALPPLDAAGDRSDPAARFAPRDWQAIRRLDALLDQVGAAAVLLDQPPLAFDEFVAQLEGAIDGARYQLDDHGVAVLPVLAARGRSFEHVCILGLSEGEFPRPLPEPALYSRAERRELRERGLPLGAPDPADERTVFYEAITRARRSLTLSRTRLDEAGAPLPRSPYLKALLDLVADVEATQVRAGSVPSWQEAASPHEQALALAVALEPPAWPAGVAPFPAWPHVLRARAIERWREGWGDYGVYEGALSDQELVAQLAARFGTGYQWSITELNDYTTCPFRFAAAHVLAIAPRHDPEDSLDSARRGQLYHAILARAARQWRDAGIAFVPEREPELQQVLAQAARQVLETAPEQFGFTPSIFWDWEREEVQRRLNAALRGFVRLGSTWAGFSPAWVEQDFGGQSARPPALIETPDGPVMIRGRIDRIDRRDDGALAVIDYKSGSAPRSIADSVEGNDLQLPVYMLAAEQMLPAGASYVERAAFLHIGSGKRSGELSGEKRHAALLAARRRVADVAREVRTGDFRVRPRDACPAHCEFETICRKNLEKRDRSE